MSKQINIFIDLETTARGPDNNPGAEYSKNKVVLAGWSCNGEIYTASIHSLLHYIYNACANGIQVKLIAHNLIFDLKYLLRDCCLDIPWTKIVYRCTAVEEYRASGHHNKWPSLEFVTQRHGYQFTKSLDLGSIIASGVDVESIDIEELKDYLEEDIKALHHIPDQDIDMQYLLPLAEMELNGLPIDIPKAEALGKSLIKQNEVNIDQLERQIPAQLQWSDGSPILSSQINVTAPRTISYILTGYPEHGLNGKNKEPQILLKGKPALTQAQISMVWGSIEPNPNLGYPINVSVLDKLEKMVPAVTWYRQYKDNNKLLSTYIQPFLAQCKVTGSTVHPSIHPFSTSTGRLSSSKPNGQNIPPVIRGLVKSTEGILYDIDWSQLEMVGAATLSNDKTLIADLQAGMDVHYQSGKSVFGWTTPSDMTKETRRVVKGVNFGLLYGGGTKGIAANTGADIKTVAHLIDSFYTRYPTIKRWQRDVLERVKDNAYPKGVDDQGESFRASYYTLPIQHGGRSFYFEEARSPVWMKNKYSFKPTETKNYPIQGFAGGDIVMLALTILHDSIAPLGAKFRMTVHDSILIDWEEGKEEELNKYMTIICDLVKDIYSIPVPLTFEIQAATHWL